MTTIRSAVLCVGFLLGRVDPAHATQTITVNSTLDEIDADTTDGVCKSSPSGVCTLRAAVMQANALTGPGVIINLPAGTYPITRPVDNVHPGNGGNFFLTAPVGGSTPISIVGATAATTIIDGSQLDRIFAIQQGRSATLTNLTVRNGFGVPAVAGGIDNGGFLTLDHVIVTGNTAGTAGGLHNDLGGTVLIVNSSIVNNVADLGGGVVSSGPIVAIASTIALNQARFAGGLYLSGNGTLINTTVANNSASEDGGGIYLNLFSDTFVNLYNSTIAFNSADNDADNSGTGGGVYSHSRPNFNIYNTVIAGNWHINPVFADDCDGTVNTHAYNRFGNMSGCTITQISGANALLNSIDDLGALQDNGGPTQTVALLAGSNAIGGAAAVCLDQNSTAITTDQRGFLRNVGNCDIGAYEFGASDPNDVVFADGFQ